MVLSYMVVILLDVVVKLWTCNHISEKATISRPLLS